MTPWTVACQTLLGSPGENTGAGCPLPSPGDPPRPGIESHGWQVDSLPLSHQGKPLILVIVIIKYLELALSEYTVLCSLYALLHSVVQSSHG